MTISQNEDHETSLTDNAIIHSVREFLSFLNVVVTLLCHNIWFHVFYICLTMAELVAANAEVARLQTLFDKQKIEIDRLKNRQNSPLTVNVEVLSDFLPNHFQVYIFSRDIFLG